MTRIFAISDIHYGNTFALGHQYIWDLSQKLVRKSKKGIHAIKHKEKEIYTVLFHSEIKNKDIIVSFINL